ncbi:hydrolase [Xylariales sp. PMI_506]|nr:hydrolase [Xylariales sp. PMI_506]KAH8645361.1 hydrolase [Xylariales sp. PMI_506]
MAGELTKFDLGLPAEENTFEVSEVDIPMPDGINLKADLYLPNLSPPTKPYGLIYVLCPYGRNGLIAHLNGRVFASRGYTVLLTSSRGTFGSGGRFVPGMTEQEDTQSVVKWMRDQTWYPGRFATFGGSYMGYTQWALLRNPPDDLIASVILCGPHDHSVHNWNRGVFRMDRISWNYFLATQEDRTQANHHFGIDAEEKKVMESLPLIDAVEHYFDGKGSWMRDFMTKSDNNDPFWRPAKHDTSLDGIKTPILLGSGWYDTFTYQSMEQYQRLKKNGSNVYFTVGPWTHAPGCGLNSMPEVFDFLDEYVAGRKKDHRQHAVKVYITGAEEWRNLPSWPPTTKTRNFYLDGTNTLSTESPTASSPSASFIFDPWKPTPTIGGPLMGPTGGRQDDSAYALRSDVLVHTSMPLTEDVEMMGKPVVKLTYATDTPYADIWIRLSEVDDDGVSHNIVEAYEVIDSQRGNNERLSITLQDGAHVFKKNTCIRLIVAGGSFPLMARNPGMKGNRTQVTDMKPVKHTIQYANGVSELILPCLY